MIDLHTHTLFSDGELIPSELARRAEAIGVKVLAFTDHVDFSNYDIATERLSRLCKDYGNDNIKLIAGVEITHTPPDKIAELAKKCRSLGAKIIVVHGETVVEPVASGTNKAAIDARVDILAHPGLITDEDASLAVKNNVALEISGRGGHSFTNGHVASVARKTGASLVFNTDAHAPRDLMDENMAATIAKGAGMADDEIKKMFDTSKMLVERVF